MPAVKEQVGMEVGVRYFTSCKAEGNRTQDPLSGSRTHKPSKPHGFLPLVFSEPDKG